MDRFHVLGSKVQPTKSVLAGVVLGGGQQTLHMHGDGVWTLGGLQCGLGPCIDTDLAALAHFVMHCMFRL